MPGKQHRGTRRRVIDSSKNHLEVSVGPGTFARADAAADDDAMPCPKGTRTKGLTRKYKHNARVEAERKRARTETYRKKRAFIDAKLAAYAAAERAGAEEAVDGRSALDRVPTVVGVMPAREIERRVTLDVEAYRSAAKTASARAGAASTSGGTIGKLAFDGRSDVGIGGAKRRREETEGEGGKTERIGTAARKKKKKNKKLNARRARQC